MSAGSLWINLMGPKRWVAAGFSLSRRDARNGIERYKARLVVQGFARFGVDYEQVYAQSARTHAATFVAYAAYHKLEFRQWTW
jgi:hypothetical protein